MKSVPDTPQPIREKPINFRGSLKDFEVGQLCFVVARRYQGRGPVKLIMHKAIPYGPNGRPDNAGFGYGSFGHWVVSAGTLMGCSVSRAKTKAARQNGKLGGRPKKYP